MKKDQKETVLELFSNIELGEKQSYKNVTVYPIWHPKDQSTNYMSLTEAIESDIIDIVEKNPDGSVPELKVKNKSDKLILLVDGEEVMGAKQNRILNTSILIQKLAELIIPVSCTEAGRWSYQSKKFRTSDNIAFASTRSKKSESVSYCLRSTGDFKSDQNEVWKDISDNLLESEVYSPTSAMKDLYEKKADNFSDQIKHFEKEKDQKGVIVLIDNKVVGFEYLSSPQVFERLHPKIIKSYLSQIDFLSKSSVEETGKDDLNQFLLEMILTSKIKAYKSPGVGIDLRIDTSKATGNALVNEGEVVHLACFSKTMNRK